MAKYRRKRLWLLTGFGALLLRAEWPIVRRCRTAYPPVVSETPHFGFTFQRALGFPFGGDDFMQQLAFTLTGNRGDGANPVPMTTKRTALCYLGMVLALVALLLWLAPPAVRAELNLYRAGNAITLGQVTHLDCRDGGFGFKFTLRDAAYLGAGSDGVAKSCDSLHPGDPVFVNFLPGHPALHWVGKLSSDLVRYALLAGSISLLLPALVLGAIRWRARATAARS